jgi:hypothetical protein
MVIFTVVDTPLILGIVIPLVVVIALAAFFGYRYYKVRDIKGVFK